MCPVSPVEKEGEEERSLHFRLFCGIALPPLYILTSQNIFFLSLFFLRNSFVYGFLWPINSTLKTGSTIRPPLPFSFSHLPLTFFYFILPRHFFVFFSFFTRVF